MDKRKQLVVAIMFFIAILVFILAWQKDTIFSLINIAEKRKPQDGKISVNPEILKEGGELEKR